MDHKKLIFPVILLAGVTACSDDGDDTDTAAKPEPSSYSVTAIDGYLHGADVWLDMNRDFIKNGDEPEATTGEDGVAVLDTTGIDNPEQYPVIVEAKEGITIDKDDIANPLGGKVTHNYAMSAPAGDSNITPLSTQVHLKIVHGMAPEEANNQVADSLGLNRDGLLDDFIAPATANAANAYAASNIVDSQSLPASAADLQAVAVPGSLAAQNYAKTTAAVNETIKATVDATNAAGGDFTEVEDVFDPSADAELDSDGDGVPDHIDALPGDPGHYKPSDKLAYTTWYMGSQVISSTDNLGTVSINDAKKFTGMTAGDTMWFYTPMKEDDTFRLSALGDFESSVSQFTGHAFTNIYVTPFDEAANSRIACAVSDSAGGPLRATGWDRPEGQTYDTYLLSIDNNDTLNSTIITINDERIITPKCNTDIIEPISKADFIVLNHVDKPFVEDGDPEVTNGNFILKLGDSSYTGTEQFTIDAYEMAKTYQIGNGPAIVVANAVNVQESADSALTGESYGKRVWIYPTDIGGETAIPYAVIAPLSDYQDFRFATDHVNTFVNVYVVAKDGVPPFGEADEVEGKFELVEWAQKYQPEGKMVYSLRIEGATGSLNEGLIAAGRNIDEFDLINYLDGPDDGDLGVAGNFILKMGGDEDVNFAESFRVSEFTFSATAAN